MRDVQVSAAPSVRSLGARCVSPRSSAVSFCPAWARLAAIALALGCSSTPATRAGSATPSAVERPREGQPDWVAPNVQRLTLDNGLSVHVADRGGLPTVSLRLVIRSGQASDGAKSGAAAMTAKLLAYGGTGALTGPELLKRLSALGVTLGLEATPDAIAIALEAPTKRVPESAALLAQIVKRPRWSEATLSELKAREQKRLGELEEDPRWLATSVLYRELFKPEQGTHPYSRLELVPSELASLSIGDCQSWYEQHVSPHNAVLVIVGDVEPDMIATLARESFGGWTGPPAPSPAAPAAPASARPKIVLVDRGASQRASIVLGSFGPERRSSDWAAYAIASELFELERTPSAEPDAPPLTELVELAQGSSVRIVEAAAATERAGHLTHALLDAYATAKSARPSPEEIDAARSELVSALERSFEDSATAAKLLGRIELLGLGEGYVDSYRRALSSVEVDEVRRAAERSFASPPYVVVVGDAARLLSPLSSLREVHVLDPAQGFRTKHVSSRNPAASLDVTAAASTRP